MKGNNSLGVRKGAWTSEEDVLLRKCIDKFGEGEWHKVPHRAGLNRCRKSCRLRWLNYLRPGIKRGEFEEDEIDMMLRLHKLLGNRWSLIAARLPGRTANDVKNYWNTYIEKKLTPKQGKKENDMNNIHINGPQNMVKAKVIRPHPRTISKNLLYWLMHTYNMEAPNNKDTTFSKNTSEEDNIEEASNNYHKELTGIHCSGGEDGNGATAPSTFEGISLEEELFSSCAAMEFTYGDAQLLTKNNPTDEESNNCWNDLPSSVDIWKSLSPVDEENHFWEYSFLSCTKLGNTKCIAH